MVSVPPVVPVVPVLVLGPAEPPQEHHQQDEMEQDYKLSFRF